MSDKTNQIPHVEGNYTTPQEHQIPRAEGTYPTPQSARMAKPSDKASSDQRQDDILHSFWQDHGREDAFPAPSTNSSSAVNNNIELNLGVSFSEANVLLNRYIRSMAHAMPFVILPSGNITAQQLSADRPVLLQAIVTVAHFHDLPKQQAMVNKLTRDISERILLYNENKSLDVLQAILVFANWYYPHVLWARQITSLMHLAMSMTEDLHLERKYGRLMNTKQGDEPEHRSGESQFPRGVDELRVLVGVYYLTSMLSTSVRTMSPAPWTKTLEDALKTLETNPESELDFFLVQIVRLQHLMQDAWTVETHGGSTPVQIYMQSFKADFDRLRQNDRCKGENRLLRMQYITCEIVIWELSLHDLQKRRNEPELLRSRIEYLGFCLEAIQALVDTFLHIPVHEYFTLPYSVYGQWAHAVITSVKFVSLQVPGWDISAFGDRLDFSKLIDEMAERFESTATSTFDGVRIQNKALWTWGKRQRKMKLMYESKMQAGQCLRSQPMAPEFDNAVFAGRTNMPDDVLSGDFFYSLDDDFWQSFAGDLDLGFL